MTRAREAEEQARRTVREQWAKTRDERIRSAVDHVQAHARGELHDQVVRLVDQYGAREVLWVLHVALEDRAEAVGDSLLSAVAELTGIGWELLNSRVPSALARARRMVEAGIKTRTEAVEVNRLSPVWRHYPPGWPACRACGLPCIDGKATCGDARCGSSTGRGR